MPDTMKIIIDLDGTLSIDRNPDTGYDRRDVVYPADGSKKNYAAYHAKCSEDLPCHPLLETAKMYIDAGHDVQIWTGRPDTYRDITEAWLRNVFGDFYFEHLTLRMRPQEDKRSTNIVKGEWMAEDNVLPDIVFDDRKKCVDFWRSFGILTCQVAENT